MNIITAFRFSSFEREKKHFIRKDIIFLCIVIHTFLLKTKSFGLVLLLKSAMPVKHSVLCSKLHKEKWQPPLSMQKRQEGNITS